MAVYISYWIASLLFGITFRGRLATHFFMVVTFIFIGLRLETGFDWPVYKDIYLAFIEDFSVLNVLIYSAVYGQEPGFLLLLGLSASYMPGYEFFQAVVTLVFLFSITSIGNFFKIKRLILLVAIILSFMLWSVGFSTLRQSLAISFFNFGFIFFLQKRRFATWAFFLISMSFQLSSFLYIGSLLLSKYLTVKKRRPSFLTFSVFGVGTFILLQVLVDLASWISPLAARKLEYYLATGISYQLDIFDFIFLTFFVAAGILASHRQSENQDIVPNVVELRKLIVVMAGIGACSILIPVVRDRISYELFILISVYLMTQNLTRMWTYIVFFVTFGIASSAMTFLILPARTAFVPYQNVVSSYVFDIPSTGRDRSGQFMDDYLQSLEQR